MISISWKITLSPIGCRGLAQDHLACQELGIKSRPANSTACTVIHNTEYPKLHPEPVKQEICRVYKGALRIM
uniref:Uncharacterized protein n=1 Tax=Pan troglodytes TaxID=9598 RepID=G2HFF0_PANTR|nr:hypothetical protein [Pan troglodytes]